MFTVMAPRCSQLLGVGHTTTRSFVTSRAFSVLTKFDNTNHNNNHTQQNATAKPQQRCMSSTTTQSVSGAAKHIVSAVQSLNGVHFMSIDQLRYVIRHNSTRANGIWTQNDTKKLTHVIDSSRTKLSLYIYISKNLIVANRNYKDC